MELINQHTKKIMEKCKENAYDAGLRFDAETLEYIVTNRDLLELSPKYMIPTLYDYWVHDVEVLKEKGKYELYPSNPYETVINTRPAISFYNDNNPDWLNVMIFYHVLAHIDFFQNNRFYRHTWEYDFTGQALSDKRVIAKLRSEKGRWVDYVIEFTRGIDNIVGYYKELSSLDRPYKSYEEKMLDFYFDIFLQSTKKVKTTEYVKEIERYNQCIKQVGRIGESSFFIEVNKKYPEFDAIFKKYVEKNTRKSYDLIQYLITHSDFLSKDENKWMQSIMQIVRKTSVFFQPQIRTKIMNEGWASYWHENLFLKDDRINGHEVDFARVNAQVTAMPRIGLNPYALGMHLFYHVKKLRDKGRYSTEFRQIRDAQTRKNYNTNTEKGDKFIFEVRENLNDFMFINTFVDQDFINKNKLFVADRRLNKTQTAWEYFVKSRKVEDYRQMLFNKLYHPPHIEVCTEKSKDDMLYLVHNFEGKALVNEYVKNTLMGIEYLWGGPVKLETSEFVVKTSQKQGYGFFSFYGMQSSKHETKKEEKKWQRVLYTMEKRRLSKKNIDG